MSCLKSNSKFGFVVLAFVTSASVSDFANAAPEISTEVLPQKVCNGSPALCDRGFDRVAFVTTHNAMAVSDDGWFLPNQRHGISRQLKGGVRALMLDVHYSREHFWNPFNRNVSLYLCHGVCTPGFGRELLVSGLAAVRDFLDANPNDVIAIIFESYVSARDISLAFLQSGLLPYLHTQRPDVPWPTLGEMAARNQRLVVFTDSEGGTFGWYHDVWSFAWETNFRNGSDRDFSCDANRGSHRNHLFILNHFLTSFTGASPVLASVVNREPLLLDRALKCLGESGKMPNFVTVDFYELGDVVQVVKILNERLIR